MRAIRRQSGRKGGPHTFGIRTVNWRLDYTVPFRSDPERRGFLAGRAIDRLFARFIAGTRTHVGLIPEEELFKIRFELLFYGAGGQPVPEKDQIISVRIDEFDMELLIDKNDWILTRLDEGDTSSLLERFRENQIVEVVVQFADGEERRSKIYPSGDGEFHVWEAMFRTCIRENVS